MAYKFVTFEYDILNYEILMKPAKVVVYVDTTLALGVFKKRLFNPRTEQKELNEAFYIKFEGNVYALRGMILEQWQAKIEGASLIPLTTFTKELTPSYPVGVFNVNGVFLGNAADSAAYEALWNADVDNQKAGSIKAVPNMPLYFKVTKPKEMSVVELIGLRYYQFEATNNVAVYGDLKTFVDWGDGTKQFCSTGKDGVQAASTDNGTATLEVKILNFVAGGFYGRPRAKLNAWRLTKAIGAIEKTVTVYHNESDVMAGVCDMVYIDSGSGTAKNLRGVFPAKVRQLQLAVSNAKANNMKFNNITNWTSLTEVQCIVCFSWTANSLDTTILPTFEFMSKLERFWCYYANVSLSTYRLLDKTVFPYMKQIGWTFQSVPTSPFGVPENMSEFLEFVSITGISAADNDAIYIQVDKNDNPLVTYSGKWINLSPYTTASAAARARLISKGWQVG